MGHYIYSTKLVMVMMLMSNSREMICHSEGRSYVKLLVNGKII